MWAEIAEGIQSRVSGPVRRRRCAPAQAAQIQRAAVAPVSSGRVLKAMAALGAAQWMALTKASNRTAISYFEGRYSWMLLTDYCGSAARAVPPGGSARAVQHRGGRSTLNPEPRGTAAGSAGAVSTARRRRRPAPHDRWRGHR